MRRLCRRTRAMQASIKAPETAQVRRSLWEGFWWSRSCEWLAPEVALYPDEKRGKAAGNCGSKRISGNKESAMKASRRWIRSPGLAAVLTIFALSLFLTTRVGSIAADVAVRELVTFNQGQYPESLTVAPDGTILVGILNTGDVMRIT